MGLFTSMATSESGMTAHRLWMDVISSNLANSESTRTAEGGAEFVEVIEAPDFAAGVQAFRLAGWQVAATSSHGGEDVFRAPWPPRCLVLLGEESGGLSASMQSAADLRLCIPGTGRVESLNVSVATGILVAEWWRVHGVRARR